MGLLGAAAAAFLVGALACWVLARRRAACAWTATGAVTVAAVLMWVAVVRVFTTGPEPGMVLVRLPALGAEWAVRCDGLSALFLALTATIAPLTTLFAVRYLERAGTGSLARYYPPLLALFAGITGVLVTVDFFFFLVCWEILTLTSFVLVAWDSREPARQRAAWKYFFMSHAATFGIIAAVLVLWSGPAGGSFHFDAMRGAVADLLATRPLLAHTVLLLLFVGFATKAGLLPMGSWLPDAYPAAPSSATAAFAGTLSKLGVYGLLRVFAEFVPLSDATATWGYVIAAAGLVSLFVGTLTALRQDDAKRLMSFHLIGQVGYITLGIGIGLALLPTQPLLAGVALLAGLFHLVNNALYKTALYLGAGAVEYRTGSTSLGGAGGLGPLMPVTAACAGLAALAIAGLPPLNGFASKWLLYVSGILGGREFAGHAVAVLVAMFISLVTLASFLKYLGGTYFGPARAEHAGLRDVPLTMLAPQLVLVALCLLFGLAPRLPLAAVYGAVASLPAAADVPALRALIGTGFTLGGDASGIAAVWSPLPLALALAVGFALVFGLLQRAGGATRRDVPVWACGEQLPPEITRYPAHSFYMPFKQAFRGLYPQPRLHAPAFPAFLRRALDLDTWLYMPAARAVQRAAHLAGRTHPGVPQVYLLWIVAGAALVVAIMALVIR